MFKKLLPDPFILYLFGTVALASLVPAAGAMAVAVDWAATVAIIMLFFFHGAKLARSAVIAGLVHWRLHLVILGCTFAIFPLLGLLLSQLLPGLLSPVLWTGVLYLVALPSTVQSSIAFVSMAKGNVSAAIASASASQVLGVFLTPFLVSILSDAQGAEVQFSGIGKIVLLILLPFTVGHLLRPVLVDFVTRNKALISVSDRTAILLAVYSAFSAAVLEGIWTRLPLLELAALLLICVVILALILVTTRAIAKAGKFALEDEKVLVFCGSKKSLVQGVPMARILFPGPDLGLILLPIMIFHQIQLMVCAVIAGRYASKFVEVEISKKGSNKVSNDE